MIAKSYIKSKKAFGADIRQIENYEKAVGDKVNKWVCHHRYETDYGLSCYQLADLNLYNKVTPNQLIFLPYLIHDVAHDIGHIPNKELWKTLLTYPISHMGVQRIGLLVLMLESKIYRFKNESSKWFWTKNNADIYGLMWKFSLDERKLKIGSFKDRQSNIG